MESRKITITKASSGYIVEFNNETHATGSKDALIRIVRKLIEKDPEGEKKRPKKRQLW